MILFPSSELRSVKPSLVRKKPAPNWQLEILLFENFSAMCHNIAFSFYYTLPLPQSCNLKLLTSTESSHSLATEVNQPMRLFLLELLRNVPNSELHQMSIWLTVCGLQLLTFPMNLPLITFMTGFIFLLMFCCMIVYEMF